MQAASLSERWTRTSGKATQGFIKFGTLGVSLAPIGSLGASLWRNVRGVVFVLCCFAPCVCVLFVFPVLFVCLSCLCRFVFCLAVYCVVLLWEKARPNPHRGKGVNRKMVLSDRSPGPRINPFVWLP